MPNPPKLSFRLGCPLAILLAAAFVLACAIRIASVHDRAIELDDFQLIQFLAIGAPFAALAIVRTRDWLAWLVGIALTGAGWGWFLYRIRLGEGVDFLIVWLILLAPFIAALSVITAGVRGQIPDWGQETGEPLSDPQREVV